MTTDVESPEETRGFAWWLILLEGLACIALAILLLVFPTPQLLVVVNVLGLFWLLKAAFQMVSIFVDKTVWGLRLLASILGILVGAAASRYPMWNLVPLSITAMVLGAQGIVVGGIDLIVAFAGGCWRRAIVGMLSMFFGILLVGRVVSFTMGGLALAGGALVIIAALRMRRD